MSKSKVILSGKQKFCSIRIGFHKVQIMDPKDCTVLNISGALEFKGTAHIGKGSKIHVAKGANLVLGNNFAISASSQFNCYHRILIGNDVQFSWDCLVMDSDTHVIYNDEHEQINADKDIVIEDKVWIGCRSTILKGSWLPSNSVIGACSVVSGNKFESNTIIVGSPAKSIKKISGWKI